MKKSLLTLGFGLAMLAVCAQPNAKPVGGNGPMISLDKESHDYGNIAQGANGTCEFTVTNTGDAPLIITQCQGSCGCTVPKCETNPIMPGQKSAITVKYDTNRQGPINKSVTITSNATNAPSKIVTIRGNVEASAASPTSPVKEASPMAPMEKH
ncbi:MAG: DUF1573 domain-containing protein [Flavobacteriales bacterium]